MMILEVVAYATLFILSTLLLQTTISFTSHLLRRLPPSPFALPIIGHLHLLGTSIHRSFHDLSLRYGPLIYLRLGSNPCVVASTAELAKELLKTNDLTCAYRQQTIAIHHLTYDSSLSFVPYGPYWKFVRKLCTWELLGNRNLSHFLPIRAKEYHRFLRVLANKSEVGESVNVSQELLKLTNNVISQMMLSTRYSETEGQAEEARTLVREVTQIFGEFNVSDFIWFCKNLDLQGFRKRFEDIHRRYDAMLERIMTEREKVRKVKKNEETVRGDDMKDFLDLLFDVLEDENSEITLTRDQVKALILDFFTAATDTSAIVVEWALTELLNHPTVLKKARNEIDEVVGKNRVVEEADGPKSPIHTSHPEGNISATPTSPFGYKKSNAKMQGGRIHRPSQQYDICEHLVNWKEPKVLDRPIGIPPESGSCRPARAIRRVL
ncbi:hypothetical protein L1049_013125 [Liquidambar formosana]|uniref:Flavone synthase II n=1 Tax=Liquidambar formosana TaxID=63359 RepID=A0AAP0WWP3_LIQFO